MSLPLQLASDGCTLLNAACHPLSISKGDILLLLGSSTLPESMRSVHILLSGIAQVSKLWTNDLLQEVHMQPFSEHQSTCQNVRSVSSPSMIFAQQAAQTLMSLHEQTLGHPIRWSAVHQLRDEQSTWCTACSLAARYYLRERYAYLAIATSSCGF